MYIPRSRTTEAGVTLSVPTRSGNCGSWWERRPVVDHRISVFAAFSWNKWYILMRCKHKVITCKYSNCHSCTQLNNILLYLSFRAASTNAIAVQPNTNPKWAARSLAPRLQQFSSCIVPYFFVIVFVVMCNKQKMCQLMLYTAVYFC